MEGISAAEPLSLMKHSHQSEANAIKLTNDFLIRDVVVLSYIHPLKTEQSFREFYAEKSKHLPKRCVKLPWKSWCPAILSGDSK